MTKEKQGREVCQALPVPAPEVERLVLGYVREFAKRREAIDEVKHLVQNRIEERLASIPPKKKLLMEQIAKASSRVTSISEDLESPLGRSEHARDARGRARASGRSEADWVADVLTNFDEMWDIMTPENKGRLVSSLLNKVTVDDRTGAVRVELAVLSSPMAGEVQDEP